MKQIFNLFALLIMVSLSAQTRPRHNGFRVVPQASPPSNPVAGEFYVDSDDNELYKYNGIYWQMVPADNIDFITLSADRTALAADFQGRKTLENLTGNTYEYTLGDIATAGETLLLMNIGGGKIRVLDGGSGITPFETKTNGSFPTIIVASDGSYHVIGDVDVYAGLYAYSNPANRYNESSTIDAAQFFSQDPAEATVSLESTEVQEGSHSVQYAYDQTGTDYIGFIQTPLTASEDGNSYTFTIWAKSDGSANPQFYFREQDGWEVGASSAEVFTRVGGGSSSVDGTWQQYTYTVTLSSANLTSSFPYTINIYDSSHTSATEFYVDDIIITQN